jgi:hypothetical protein
MTKVVAMKPKPEPLDPQELERLILKRMKMRHAAEAIFRKEFNIAIETNLLSKEGERRLRDMIAFRDAQDRKRDKEFEEQIDIWIEAGVFSKESEARIRWAMAQPLLPLTTYHRP